MAQGCCVEQSCRLCREIHQKGYEGGHRRYDTYNTYKNQQGVDVNTTDIIASDIVLMTMPQGQQQAGGAAPVQNAPQHQGSYQAGGGYQQQPQQQPQPVQQVNNNYQQGGYQPFPPPAGDDLPF